jgi:hypothetical protein
VYVFFISLKWNNPHYGCGNKIQPISELISISLCSSLNRNLRKKTFAVVNNVFFFYLIFPIFIFQNKNKKKQHNPIATMPKKESNYSHSPNGANGKMLPNYVNQAKFGAKLLQQNSNVRGQKSTNSIGNAGPNNIDYGRFCDIYSKNTQNQNGNLFETNKQNRFCCRKVSNSGKQSSAG